MLKPDGAFSPSTVQKDSGWRLFLRSVFARAYPRLIGQQREPSWFLFEVILPVSTTIAYVLVYKALRAPQEYIGFVVMGGAMTAFWMNMLWSMASQLYWEKESGNLALYIIAPTPKMALLLGMALGGMVATSLRALLAIGIGSLLFHVTYQVADFLQLFAVFLLTMVALYGMGMMLASAFLLFGREAWNLVNLAQEPIFLVSGFYFPIKSLPFWVGILASILPLTLGMDAMRQLVFPSAFPFGFLDVTTEILVLSALAVVFLVSAKWLLDYVERLAVREGRLTESRR